MKTKGNRDGETGRRGDGETRPRVSVSLVFIAFCFFTLVLTSNAHEPITTKVRFNKELVRILQRNCLGCHHPGGIAFSLATYDEARPWAKAIKEEVLEKRMPPWRAVRGYGEFRNAPSLTQRDIDLIVNWVEGGAPKGEDKDLPSGPLFSNDWQLGKPDLILTPDAESKIAGDADDHRTFVISTNLKQARWLTALDLRPGNASTVHCAVIYLLKAEASADSPAPMMPVKSEESRDAVVLATWMPGQKTVAFGDGVARLLPAGSRVAVRIHYRGSGEATTDQSSVGLYLAKTPPKKQLQELALTNPDALIPAGAELQHLRLSSTIESDTEAIAIRPSAHPLLVSLQATAYRPDGSQEVLVWSRGYQSDWEPTYYFKQPMALPKGTRIEVIAYFDNSEGNQNNAGPAKQVRWSELKPAPLCALLVANAGGVADQPGTR